jgi:hypothetical protein
MGERTTGATPEQIEAAVAKWKTCPEKDVPAFRRVVTGYAEDLVPPGSLIFDERDIEAIQRTLAVYQAAEAVIAAASPDLYTSDSLVYDVPVAELTALWNACAIVMDGHDDRRLVAKIGDGN